MSVVAAALAKYGTMPAPTFTRPPVAFDGVPQTDGAGAQLVLPWVNLVNEEPGTTAEYTFEYDPIETTTLRWDVWAVKLADADAIALWIKYGGGGKAAQLGFDFGVLTVAGQAELECVRVREHRGRAPQAQETGLPVHLVSLWYTVKASVA